MSGCADPISAAGKKPKGSNPVATNNKAGVFNSDTPAFAFNQPTKGRPPFRSGETTSTNSIVVAESHFRKAGANLPVCSESPQRFPSFLEMPLGDRSTRTQKESHHVQE
jgi:hypothetical protein